MLSNVYSRGLAGIDGFPVTVETDISNGMPAFDIVGLPDAAVKEAKERVRSAIKNTGFKFPARRIIINLAPAAQRKEGSGYDLPMAVSILSAMDRFSADGNYIKKCVFLGELSLDGTVNGINGVLPMVISAYREGFTEMFVPAENADEAAVIDGVNVYPVKSLEDLCNHFEGIKKIPRHTVDLTEYFARSAASVLDFCDVKGQENVKRALEIAAAGNHNVHLIGSPGTGKTMLAQRMPSILPDLTFDEALEVTKVHSISAVGLSGGGTVPRPGELSLAHNGILFLDELPEFSRSTLEIMRQPLEDGVVTISRVNATLTYPCNIMLIASMNPCKCGYLGDTRKQCTCTPAQINRYRSKISGPLLDRIDIQVEVPNVDYDDLSSTANGETSADVKKRVNRARKVQLERYRDLSIYSNSQLDAGMLQKYCPLDGESNAMLKAAFDNLGLSARAHGRILKVARTIADLEGSENIKAAHIAEAIQYRSLDRKYFE